MPEVSIIVPVYKTEAYLPRCIDSILAQSFTDFELILVDDGSPDRCGAICDEYAAKDSRIKVIHKENGGVSSARNAALDVAVGTYIAFVDSDDYLEFNYIFPLIKYACDLTICGLKIRDEKDNVIATNQYSAEFYPKKSGIEFVDLYAGYMLYSPYCKLFRADIIRNNGIRFVQEISWGEDGMFVSDYLVFINNLYILENTGYNYVQHNGETSLATRIRYGIIDEIVYSREYCIGKMKKISPCQYEQVKLCCSKDIKSNCAYFVKKLLANFLIKKSEKVSMLSTYMESAYVIETFLSPNLYYSEMAGCFDQREPRKIVQKYNRLYWKKRAFALLYYHIYEKQPLIIKKAYRMAKRALRHDK